MFGHELFFQSNGHIAVKIPSLIRYLYKEFVQLTIYYNIPTVSCWEQPSSNEAIGTVNHIEMDENEDIFYRHNLYYYYDRQQNIVCDGPGLPVFFYLEITWYLSGLTLFTLYILATYLRYNHFRTLFQSL